MAALLQQHGIDPAQLQQERPDAYAQLTLPLARLLVQWLVGREGVRTNRNSPSAAVVAGRLVHLAADWGVAPEDIDRIYVQRPANMHFTEGRAREVLAWLRDNLLQPEQLRRLAAQCPSTVRSTTAALAASKAAVQQFFGLADGAQWAEAVRSNPNLLAFSSSTAEGVAAWLQSADVGLPAAEVAKLCKRSPSIFKYSPSTLSARLEHLMRRLQIPRGGEAPAAGQRRAVQRKRPVQGTILLGSFMAVTLSEELLESKVAAFERYGGCAPGQV